MKKTINSLLIVFIATAFVLSGNPAFAKTSIKHHTSVKSHKIIKKNKKISHKKKVSSIQHRRLVTTHAPLIDPNNPPGGR